MCTAVKDLYKITLLRSYDLPQMLSVPSTISEAALATSAAISFFKPVVIGSRQFMDGAVGANNPVEQVQREASEIWCADTGNLMPQVKCFISIGAGCPSMKPVEDNILKFSKTLVKIATETEETARRFSSNWREPLDYNRYFRFNVEHGLENIGLAEYQKEGSIETATHQYLEEQRQIFSMRDCVRNLKQKEIVYHEDLAQLATVPQLMVRSR